MRIRFVLSDFATVPICTDIVKVLKAQVSKACREATTIMSAFDGSTACFSSAANVRNPPLVTQTAFDLIFDYYSNLV